MLDSYFILTGSQFRTRFQVFKLAKLEQEPDLTESPYFPSRILFDFLLELTQNLSNK